MLVSFAPVSSMHTIGSISQPVTMLSSASPLCAWVGHCPAKFSQVVHLRTDCHMFVSQTSHSMARRGPEKRTEECEA